MCQTYKNGWLRFKIETKTSQLCALNGGLFDDNLRAIPLRSNYTDLINLLT
jgi:hypothetical protein